MFVMPGTRANRSNISQTKPYSATYSSFLAANIGVGSSASPTTLASLILPPGRWDLHGQVYTGCNTTSTLWCQIYNATDGVVLAGSERSFNSGFANSNAVRFFAVLNGTKTIILRAFTDNSYTAQAASDTGSKCTYLIAVRTF